MKNADTWMPLYIGDYLGDTMHLTCEQHGAYLLLLMALWRSKALPLANSSLATICHLDLLAFEARIAPAVMAFFTPTPHGYVQKRLTSERTSAEKISESRRYAGRLGGLAKVAKRVANAQQNGRPLPSQIRKKETHTPCESRKRAPAARDPSSATRPMPPAAPELVLTGGSAAVVELRPNYEFQAFEAYNAMAMELGLTTARGLPPGRVSKLRARLKEVGGLDGWMAALEMVRKSEFITSHAWANFSLGALLQPETLAKLMDGAYTHRLLTPPQAEADRQQKAWNNLDGRLDEFNELKKQGTDP